MSKVISSFLVGIGIEFDKQSGKQAEDNIMAITRRTVQLGAALVGAFGVKEIVSNFTTEMNKLDRFAEVFNVSPEGLLALGTAAEMTGGSLETIKADLSTIEKLRAGLLVGDVGTIQQIARAGIDPALILDAKDAQQAFINLADAYSKFNNQERLNANKALGFDDSAILLLSKGSVELGNLVDKFAKIRPVTDEYTDSTKKLNNELVELKANLEGIKDVPANMLTKAAADTSESVNEFIDDNREGIKSTAKFITQSFMSGIGQLVNPAGIFSDDEPSVNDIDGKFNRDTIEQPKVNPVTTTPYPGYGVNNDLINQSLLPSYPYGGNNDLINQSTYYSAPVPTQATQQPQAALPTQESTVTPAQAPVTQNVNVTLQLDGATLDKRTVRIMDGMAQTAVDNIASNVGV